MHACCCAAETTIPRRSMRLAAHAPPATFLQSSRAPAAETAGTAVVCVLIGFFAFASAFLGHPLLCLVPSLPYLPSFPPCRPKSTFRFASGKLEMLTGGGDLEMILMGMDTGTLGVARLCTGHLVCVYAEVPPRPSARSNSLKYSVCRRREDGRNNVTPVLSEWEIRPRGRCPCLSACVYT